MKKYDSYKDSGIEWIGDIPKHWDESKIKYLSKEPNSLFIDGDWIESKVIIEEGIRYITTGNIKVGYYSEQGTGFISEETFDELNCTEVFEGDLVISRLNNPIGRACIIPNLNNRIVTSVDNVIFRPDSNVNKFYLLYLFSSKEYFEITDLISRGATMQRISRGLYGNIKIPLPSIEEQTAIANYLNHKTTQIDTLIAKKEQFISLLHEERTAVINQAVTKGLDPKVQMKDSGIEWLGEIPDHWEVKKLKYVGNCQNGISEGAEFFGTGHPFVSYSDVYKNDVLPKNVFGLANSNEKHQENYSVEESDVFFTRTSETVEEIGIASICNHRIEKAVFAGFLIRFRPNKDLIIKEFSKYYFRCFIPRTFFVKEMNLVTRASLSQELLKRLPTLLPSINEQQRIATFLDKKTSEIDIVIFKSKQEIELLKEYKTALISEVVTGKVDVRDVVLN